MVNKVYIITALATGHGLKVSQEGYDSYQKAVRFIKSREGDIAEITPFHYQARNSEDPSCDILWDYFINEVIIK